ncbi:MAG: Serine/threonine-protein kinase [Watsoniomyces obsoletus]|nr:MAG: Serine/threonine-protein kinase [Watsoniomyces obsoletus]
MDTAVELSDASRALDLSHIRFQLIRLEDTITFHLIERVQFPVNRTIYIPGALHLPQTDLSFLDWMLREQERLHSLVRRYQSPDEHPFFPDVLETPILKPLRYPEILHPNSVNLNTKLKKAYIEQIVPDACASGGRHHDRGEDQENYGSTGVCDVACLQALSRRVHFGKFVAEAKFRQDPTRFEQMIRADDRAGIATAITDEKVEKKVLERLRLKAKTYGTDPSNGMEGPVKINVDAVAAMYRDIVIPLTKEVEVEYLMQRLEDSSTPG